MTAHTVRSADSVLRAAESCLAVGAQSAAGHNGHECRQHIHELIGDAAIQFAQERRWDEAFNLMSSVRLDVQSSPALFQLHNALLRYERQRITRVRRRLLYLLCAVLIYMFAVAPSVFVALENPYRIAHGMSELDW